MGFFCEQLWIDHFMRQSFVFQMSNSSYAGDFGVAMACPTFLVFNAHYDNFLRRWQAPKILRMIAFICHCERARTMCFKNARHIKSP
jgi:hypothetical protein